MERSQKVKGLECLFDEYFLEFSAPSLVEATSMQFTRPHIGKEAVKDSHSF